MASKGTFITTLPFRQPRAGQADSDPASIDRLPAVPGHPVYASVPLFSDRFPSAIRLLALCPQKDSTSQVRAILFSTSLDEHPESYNALSYAWTHDTSATIIVNGRPFKVSEDLYQCMQAMTKHVAKGAIPFLWVDAICINQADDVERAAQVAIMSRIYRSCRECLVWLGPEQDDSHLVFALVKEFEDLSDAAKAAGEELYLEKINQMYSMDKHGMALVTFCTRPYWSRLWILQENMLAPQVRLLVGDRMADGASFRNILRNMALLTDERFFSITRQVGHNMQQLFELSAAQHAGSVLDVLQGLLVSGSCEFTDGRDVVYAILGLVDPQQTQKMEIKVDYSISTNRLWGAVTSRVVRQSRSLNILTLCQPIAADPDIKEAAFQAKTNLIEHFLNNSMNDFYTALAVWRRIVGKTTPNSMAIDHLGYGTLEEVREATQQLQSRRHLMSDFEFKRALAQAWLPRSRCDSHRLPTWVPNWSKTRKINSHILYGLEKGQIIKRNFRASKNTEPNIETLADLDPDSLPSNTEIKDRGSFTTMSLGCHKVDTVAQIFEARRREGYQHVLEYWLVQSGLHHLIASMSLSERVAAFTDMLLLKSRSDKPELFGYDLSVDDWVKSSREACTALINESTNSDTDFDALDSSSSKKSIAFLSASKRPAAVAAALKLLASDTVEFTTPKVAFDDSPDDNRRKIEYLRDTLVQMYELEGNYNMFITRGGFIGLAGYDVAPGDIVCIPLGCDVPLVIRPAPDTSTTVKRVFKNRAACRGGDLHELQDGRSTISQGISELLGPEYRVVDRPKTTSENYWLISDSYVVGIMDGEYLDHLDDTAEPEMITIY